MCGRTACTLAPDELCKACNSQNFNVQWRDHPGTQHNYFPSYNVAPTAHTPIMFSGKHMKNLATEEAESEYVMQPMMWNLIPHFYKGDTPKNHGYKTNNCRVESVEEKQMFSHLLKKGQRCVVLCDGFYEWHTKDKTKTPYFIYAPQPQNVQIWERSSWEETVKKEDDVGNCPDEPNSDWKGPALLKMAGLFSKWKSAEGEEVWSYTVLTMEAGKGFNWLHHRIPVILSSEDMVKSWLDPDTPHSKVLKRISSSPDVKWHTVSDEVNNSRNNTAKCMKPFEASSGKKPVNKLMSAWLVKGKKPRTASDTSKPQVELERQQEAPLDSSKRKSSHNFEKIDHVKKAKLDSEEN